MTEEIAIDLTRQALILDGKSTPAMRPIADESDPNGRPIFYSRNTINPDEGTVFWWLGRSDMLWEYSVRLRREGDKIVCSISRAL
jgi:hypothetical protein